MDCRRSDSLAALAGGTAAACPPANTLAICRRLTSSKTPTAAGCVPSSCRVIRSSRASDGSTARGNGSDG